MRVLHATMRVAVTRKFVWLQSDIALGRGTRGRRCAVLMAGIAVAREVVIAHVSSLVSRYSLLNSNRRMRVAVTWEITRCSSSKSGSGNCDKRS